MIDERKLRITVGINSLTAAQYPAYSNHIQYFFRLGRDFPNIEVVLVNPSRCSIDRFRNMAVETALNTESDYLLFIDDDVLLPMGSLPKLLDADGDIVAGHVLVRGYPFKPMAFISVDKNDPHKGLRHPADLSEFGDQEIIDVDAIGTSYALIKTSLLKKIPKPHFVTGISSTEDIYFCIRARQVDPNCSIKVHRGVECAHILWPELIQPSNREAYSTYFLTQNPQARAEAMKSGDDDRGQEYIDMLNKLPDPPKVPAHKEYE